MIPPGGGLVAEWDSTPRGAMLESPCGFSRWPLPRRHVAQGQGGRSGARGQLTHAEAGWRSGENVLTGDP